MLGDFLWNIWYNELHVTIEWFVDTPEPTDLTTYEVNLVTSSNGFDMFWTETVDSMQVLYE